MFPPACPAAGEYTVLTLMRVYHHSKCLPNFRFARTFLSMRAETARERYDNFSWVADVEELPLACAAALVALSSRSEAGAAVGMSTEQFRRHPVTRAPCVRAETRATRCILLRRPTDDAATYEERITRTHSLAARRFVLIFTSAVSLHYMRISRPFAVRLK